MIQLPEIPKQSVIGINYSGMHDSSIAIVSPTGQIIFAQALERISRIKQDGRPPYALLENIPWDIIAKVAVTTEREFIWPEQTESVLLETCLPSIRKEGLIHGHQFYDFLQKIPCEKEFVCHQLAHASSAFWGSGFESAFCLTYDGGMCNSPWFGGFYKATKNEGIHALDQFSALHYAKVTSLYTFVTALLGFTPNKHEGKITGLAAFGKPTNDCRALIKSWFEDEFLKIEAVMEWFFVYDEESVPMLLVKDAQIAPFREVAAKFSREELAATVQEFAENHIVNILKKTQQLGWAHQNICLAGGLFANVKINQRVIETGFKKLFVAPPMTDDGTALGAAWHVVSKNEQFDPPNLRSMHLGSNFDKKSTEGFLQSEQITYQIIDEPAEKIANLLAEGAVVALFQGAMEFGPRALGNRSILAQATKAEINESLNLRLNRTEFMPFAPITRIEDAESCYQSIDKVLHSAEFMTVTVNCQKQIQIDCPAVVHVDGTARPQIVYADANPFLHEILSAYKQLTNKSALVNTSFNIHEEPIVCSPLDALHGFFESGLDYLYLDHGFFIAFKGNENNALRYLRRKQTKPNIKIKQLESLLHQQSKVLLNSKQELEIKELEIASFVGTLKQREQSMLEKESAIQNLSYLLTTQEKSLQEKEHAIYELVDNLKERQDLLEKQDKEIHQLSDSPKSLLESLLEKEQEINEKEQEINEKEQEINEKQREIISLNKRLYDLNTALEEKEFFIQVQQKFIDQSNFFRVYALKFLVRIASFILIKFRRSFFYAKIIRYLGYVKGFLSKTKAKFNSHISGHKIKFKQKYGPFLGVLNQYPPREMKLPKRYYKAANLNNPLKISIVTPSYQQGDYIERTLKSVLDQGYPNLEYFVQDGGSKDNTVEILKKYEHQLTGWESERDNGQSHAINLGFAKTSGDIMAWLNSDDLLLPGTLAYVGKYFAKHPDVDVIYGNRIIIDENDMEIGRWVMPRNDYAVLSWADFIPQETIFWRRSIWEKAGGTIDESFQFAMDWDLLVRFREATAGINRLPRFLGAFRVHTKQKTSALIEEIGRKDMQKIRTRCNGFEPTQEEIIQNIKNYLRWHFIEHNFRLLHYKR